MLHKVSCKDANSFMSLTPNATWKKISRLVSTSAWLFPFSFRSNHAGELCLHPLREPHCSLEFISNPLVYQLCFWCLLVPFLSIHPARHSRTYISQPGNLSCEHSSGSEQEWTSTLLVCFWRQVLNCRNHLAPGSWSFSCFHRPRIFFQHYLWKLISISWLPYEDLLEITLVLLMSEPMPGV